MCVIIHKLPGTEIPFDSLKSACTVNPDGMGLVAIDRGRLELRKIFEAKGNDPDTLAKFLEQGKDLDCYVHLRFRTKGSTDKDNVHPFGVLKAKRHGIDVQFMHNGTLSDFGTDKSCDSKEFASKLLRPLSEKLIKAIPPEQLLHDETFIAILDKYAGRGSVFLLADNHGNHRIINYANGKEFDGWWASNEYSFNRLHREKSYSTYYHRKPSWDRDESWVQKPSVAAVPAPKEEKPPFNDEVPFKAEVKEVARQRPRPLPDRTRFTEVAEIEDLADVCSLSKKNIEDLVESYPDEAVLLIMDLIKELYDRDLSDDDDVYEERDAA